jgi:hypothetical protein
MMIASKDDERIDEGKCKHNTKAVGNNNEKGERGRGGRGGGGHNSGMTKALRSHALYEFPMTASYLSVMIESSHVLGITNDCRSIIPRYLAASANSFFNNGNKNGIVA